MKSTPKLDKPVKMGPLTNYKEAKKFAKKVRNHTDELGNLARAFLAVESDMKMSDDCMAKADMWLSRARG